MGRESEKRKGESDPSPRAIRHLSFPPLTSPTLSLNAPTFPWCSTRSMFDSNKHPTNDEIAWEEHRWKQILKKSKGKKPYSYFYRRFNEYI
jgi:hypothetical protein